MISLITVVILDDKTKTCGGLTAPKPPSHSCVEIDFLCGVSQDKIVHSKSEDGSPVITAEVSFLLGAMCRFRLCADVAAAAWCAQGHGEGIMHKLY